MAKTNRERVIDYLWSVGERGATNAEIREATGISPHQQVYLLTQELKQLGKVEARRQGRECTFILRDDPQTMLEVSGDIEISERENGSLSPKQFEELSRQVMSQVFGVPLEERDGKGLNSKSVFRIRPA
jgi:hypothetical protein